VLVTMTGSTSRQRVRFRLIPVAAACWTVAFVSTLAPEAAPRVAVLLWSLGLMAIIEFAWASRALARRPPGARSPWRVVAILCLLASGAAASHVALATPARTEAAAFGLDGGRAVVVEATVTGKVERRAAGDYAFDALATRIATGRAGEEVHLDVVIRVQRDDVDGWYELDVGASVLARGDARPGYPGDRAVLEVSAGRGLRVVEPATGALAVVAALRRSLVASAEGLPGPGSGLIPGLAVGDTSAVSGELDAQMKSSSLSHLTAVSGANCALVVGLAFAAAAAAGASRRARVAAGLACLTGFVLLVTPEPSVVRAAAMAAVAMFGVLLGRTGVGVAVLCLAVSILLIADPWLSGSLGFALSTVATASLLLFARPLAAGLTRWMPRALALGLSVPIAAQLACGPLLVLITPTVPVYGILANVLAAPAAPVATIVGLAACLVAPLPVLQAGLTAVAWLPAAWIAQTAAVVTTLPGDQLAWVEGWGGATLLALFGCAIGLLLTVAPTRHRPTRVMRALAGVLAASVIGTAVGAAALSTVAGRWTIPARWSVLACDVGQGDAVFVRSAGVVALIDTGPEPEPLAACLSRIGIDRIDLLVLTHFDLDHVGGIAAVTGRVGRVLHGPVVTAGDAAVLDELTSAGAERSSASAGMHGSLGEAAWRIVWPRPDSAAFPSGNDASVVIDIGGGGVPSALFLGDLSAAPQRALGAAESLDGSYEVVKVAHHGSADQDAGLYDDIDADVALFTVGAENDYGHPRAETLAMLAEAGASIARTDREGVIAIWQVGDDIAVWRERRPVAGSQESGVGGDR
jgi:competence protein ComEC